jgi:Tripartite tricarboxylate transporter TctB family
MQRSAKDLLAGATFVVFGIAFAFGAVSYEVGNPVRMGPGYYPLVVGGLLTVLGIVIIVKPSPEDDPTPLTGPSWRALVLIVGAFIVFGLTVRGLGLAPSTFLAATMASLSSPQMRVPTALGLSLVLTIVSVLVFVFGLSLRLPLWGPWIPL